MSRSSQVTATTMFTKRTSLSHHSMADTSASCHGSGTSASPCEWSSWAVTSSTPQYLSPVSCLLLLALPLPVPPLPSLLSLSWYTCTALLWAVGGRYHQGSTSSLQLWLVGCERCYPLTTVTTVQIYLNLSLLPAPYSFPDLHSPTKTKAATTLINNNKCSLLLKKSWGSIFIPPTH